MAGSVLLGTLGFTAGILVGAPMESSCSYYYTGLECSVLVARLWGHRAATGVHAAKHGRGNPWLVVGASVAVGAAGRALVFTVNQAVLLPVAAVGQLVACAAAELGTMPDPESAGAAKLQTPARIPLRSI